MPQVSTKASKARSASFLVSAIQISCSARLAFDCWLYGNLFRTLAVLCTQQRWPRVPGAAHGDRTDAGHDLALGQMPMAHQPLAAIIGELVGVAAEQGRDFGFNGLCQQHAGTVGKTSVSESAKLPGWESRKTLVS